MHHTLHYQDARLCLDFRRVFKDTGRLLVAFLVGSAATVAGTLLAFKALPLSDMGVDGWKVLLAKAFAVVLCSADKASVTYAALLPVLLAWKWLHILQECALVHTPAV